MTPDEAQEPDQLDARVSLGHRLRKAREDRGMSAEEASRASGVKTATLLRYERGKCEASALKVVALAEAYGACCNLLLGREECCPEPRAGHAVLDLDILDAVERAETEADMRSLIMWRPPPVFAVVSLPLRQRVVGGQEASGIGSFILEKLREVAPAAHRRWADQHVNGVA
jgi:transcriptional regulator with XRE-family HTH domain